MTYHKTIRCVTEENKRDLRRFAANENRVGAPFFTVPKRKTTWREVLAYWFMLSAMAFCLYVVWVTL